VKKNLTTIVLIAGALLAVFLLTFHLHQTSKEQVLSQFSENQLQIAQQVAKQIESYFRSRFHELRSFSSLASLRDTDREKMVVDIQSHFEYLKMIHVKEISLLDKKGTVVYSTTAGAKRENHSQADFFSWAKNPGNKGAVRIGYEKADEQRRPLTPGSPAPPSLRIFLVAPFYRETAGGSHKKPGEEFAGAIMFTVNLEKMLAERSVLFTPVMKLHLLWIMDKDGTVLLQSEHPEMLMRNIREKDETCNQCHTSFDHVEAMLGKPEGATEYQLKGKPKKISAFTSMSFGNAAWIVVVNAPLDEATGFVRENLKETLLLLGIVSLVLGLAFYFAYRTYRQRADSEMEVKRLRENQALLEELRETRDYLENLFNYANAPIIVWNTEFRITRFNRAFELLTGRMAGDVIGKNIEILFPPTLVESSMQLIKKTLTGERWETIEIDILHIDGTVRTVLWNSATIFAADGTTPIATIAQGHDITERKRAEGVIVQARDDWENTFDNVTDMITIQDMDFNIIHANPAARAILGAQLQEEIPLAKCFRYYHGMDSPLPGCPSCRSLQTGLPVTAEMFEPHLNKHLEFRAMPRFGIDRRVVGLIHIVRDITERKLAEKKLEDTLESLRKAVGMTIQVMVSAVETRDPYTSGHQSRSATLARAIATEMGLPQEKIDAIRMAGSIHDIGKLSIPAEILSKPTKLSDIEFSLIKEHARKGYEMLKDVESPWPLAEIVYQHHERMDGSGYPRNLKGDEICIEARILAVADVVEAMASHRPYRAGLGIVAALEEIEKNSGIFYDNVVADACLRLFREKGLKLEGIDYNR